ncbi:LuxR C-terminal-related transcriptional regulator [Lentzea sp. NPDC051838]|uniref:ATP-binding protein n=1 Tax=Lentzea sp. NPDC051838 TaxID=3154849 RepID=UPI00342A9042
MRAITSTRAESKSVLDHVGVLSIDLLLPAQRDGFVGRRAELNQLRGSFETHRLVTLVGPGGVGKTRLALEFLGQHSNSRTALAVPVELDVVSDGDMIAHAVATALGVHEQGERPVSDSVFEALDKARVTLLLDNCEHLVESCSSFVDLALSRCPRLRILATSREALGVRGEVVVPVDGLPLPHLDTGTDVAGSLNFDAIALFVERAQESAPDFTLTPDNAGHVAAVCAELDGNPLAIELATRWVTTLKVEDIRSRLGSRFELLTTGRRSARARQRSLRNAIEWSYELLSSRERAVFLRLSVLSGPFDVEAGVAVCAKTGIGDHDVLAAIARLRATSLLSFNRDTNRYRLLESIRLFGLRRLEATGEADATCDVLAAWLAELAEPLVRQPLSYPRELQRRLDGLSGSLDAALRWTARADSSDDTGNRRHAVLTAALATGWMAHGHVTESRRLVRSAFERGGLVPVHRVLLLTYKAQLALLQGRLTTAAAALDEAWTVEVTPDAAGAVLGATCATGGLHLARAEFDKALERFEECLAMAGALHEPVTAAAAEERIAWTWLMRGDADRAAEVMARVLPEFDVLPVPRARAVALHTAGAIALARNRLDEAETYLRDSLRASGGTMSQVSFALDGLAMHAERTGRPGRAIGLAAAAAIVRGGTVLPDPLWRHQVEDVGRRARATAGPAEAERLTSGMADLAADDMIAYALHDADLPAARPKARPATLDDDEQVVADLVAAGFTNNEIAARLGVSLRTVANRLRTIREQLGLGSRRDIVEWTTNTAGHPEVTP